jgi:uncharacterized membrane protein YphA (DoxX/SURF4 family)
MKTVKIIYWVTTLIVVAMMAFDAYLYFTKPEMQQAFQHLGFPGYFPVELGIGKIIGCIFLLFPISKQLREWSYAGFVIVFISAFIAHRYAGDPMAKAIMPLIFLLILLVSYWSYHKILQSGHKEIGSLPVRQASIA